MRPDSEAQKFVGLKCRSAGGARAAAVAKREAVVGAVANALRILLDNLEAKSRCYKNKVNPMVPSLATSWFAPMLAFAFVCRCSSNCICLYPSLQEM